jgi:hypothetical protein
MNGREQQNPKRTQPPQDLATRFASHGLRKQRERNQEETERKSE